ncbi:hypothetical protein, partial [Providencia stuartii]|uniref:hypothetical protein n=1 Tax=Providencia stuartii TaxID=588 RepID=UPI001954EC18
WSVSSIALAMGSGLKTPYELLKEYEKELKKKSDLEIVYIENMAHELVNFQTLKFEDKVVLE